MEPLKKGEEKGHHACKEGVDKRKGINLLPPFGALTYNVTVVFPKKYKYKKYLISNYYSNSK